MNDPDSEWMAILEVNGNLPNDEDQNGYGNENAPGTYTNLDVCFLCAKKSTFICEKCGLVAFCSEACQKVHRPENFCFPFMVEQVEGVTLKLMTTSQQFRCIISTFSISEDTHLKTTEA